MFRQPWPTSRLRRKTKQTKKQRRAFYLPDVQRTRVNNKNDIQLFEYSDEVVDFLKKDTIFFPSESKQFFYFFPSTSLLPHLIILGVSTLVPQGDTFLLNMVCYVVSNKKYFYLCCLAQNKTE